MTTIINWTEFFKEEKDIYVQNIANAQISLEFIISPGQTQGFTVPQTRDPFNLTQHIPWNAIKGSADFRRMLNRRPPALLLLTEAEFQEYYAKKAANSGKSAAQWQSEMDAAETRRQGIQNRTAIENIDKPKPIHEVTKQGTGLFGDAAKEVRSTDVATEDEIINPRVLHFCHQVNNQIPDAEKMKAHDLLNNLQTLEGELKLDDYEYIRSHGHWKTVKTWAKTKAAALSSDAGEGAEDLSEQATAPATP
jgi:hypothetical protein